MLEFLNHIDTSVFLFFNGMHTPFLDRFMMLFTGRFIWIPMYAAILIVLLRTHGVKSAGIYVLAIALAITLTDQTCATFIRPMVERLRPSNLENPLSALTIVVDDYRGGSYGFPSCHSANSFALATFMAFLFPRRRMLMFIFGWAALNSYTRLYLGVHYPGDLLVGAVIGSAFGYLCYRIANYLDPVKNNNDGIERLSQPIFNIPIGPVWANIGRMTITVTVGDILIAVGAVTSAIILAAAAINHTAA